jgi:hypothetical protein
MAYVESDEFLPAISLIRKASVEARLFMGGSAQAKKNPEGEGVFVYVPRTRF